MTNFMQPDFSNMNKEEILAWALKVEQQNREFQEKENRRKEEEALRAWARKESRFTSTRNTLVLRRTPNHEEIAPARDVRDYLELYDLKDPETAKGKKTRVSDDEIIAYQQLKEEGVENITPAMVKNKMQPSGKPTKTKTESEDGEETSTTGDGTDESIAKDLENISTTENGEGASTPEDVEDESTGETI